MLFALINQSALHIGCFAFCSVFKGLLCRYQQLINHIRLLFKSQTLFKTFFRSSSSAFTRMTFPSNSDFVSLTGLDDSVNSKFEMFFKLFSKVVFSLATLFNLSFLKKFVKGFRQILFGTTKAKITHILLLFVFRTTNEYSIIHPSDFPYKKRTLPSSPLLIDWLIFFINCPLFMLKDPTQTQF